MRSLILSLLATSLCCAELTKFEWDTVDTSNPDNEILQTHLYVVSFIAKSPIFLAESKTNTVTVNLISGTYQITAASKNKQGWSDYCDPITVHVAAPITPPIHIPKKTSRFILQKTQDLTKWENVIELLQEDESTYWRLMIISE